MSLAGTPEDNSNIILGALFGPCASGTILPIADHLDALYPTELEIIRNASRRRQLEFSTGRFCAKTTLASLGVVDYPILRNKHREPCWPSGFVGSISHCRDLCGAVIANNSDIKAIGFDIENIKTLKQNISKLTCTSKELDWLTQQTAYSYDTLVILLFSLKEAIFKCVFPHQNIQLGFKDCSIMPDFDSGRAEIHFHRQDVAPNIELNFHMTKQHIYSGAYRP